jgi:hypothetical protein
MALYVFYMRQKAGGRIGSLPITDLSFRHLAAILQ